MVLVFWKKKDLLAFSSIFMLTMYLPTLAYENRISINSSIFFEFSLHESFNLLN